MPTKSLKALVPIMALLAFCTHTAITAPYTRGAPAKAVSDDVLSLANLESVHIHIDDLPPLLEKFDVTHEDVVERLKQRLVDAELRVVADEKTPQVRLRIEATHDPVAPEAIAFSMTISVMQRSHVERVDRHLRVPTYHHTRIGMFDRGQTTEMVRLCVGLVVEKLARKVAVATREEEGEGGE